MKLVSRGFAITQHLAVTAISVVLVTFAASSCTSHLQKARLAQGVQALGRYQLGMEQFYLAHGTYESATQACGVPPPEPPKFFTFACETDGDSYRATLTGTGALSGYRYVLDDTATPHKTELYEGVPVSKSCWLTREAHC